MVVTVVTGGYCGHCLLLQANEHVSNSHISQSELALRQNVEWLFKTALKLTCLLSILSNHANSCTGMQI